MTAEALFAGVLFWLVFGHFLMDFALQTEAIALGKNWNIGHPGAPWYYWMSAHSMLHAGSVVFITGSLWLGLMELGLHFAADCLKCAKLTNIHVDQAFHMGCKFMWAYLAVYSGA